MAPPRFRSIALAAILTALAAPASAQDAADRLLAPPPAQAKIPEAPPPEARDTEEQALTRILNAEIVAQNALAENQERADRAAYEAAAARHTEALARAEAARLAYEAERRAAEDAQARYDRDHAQWQARLRACQAGDRRACGGGS